jgi:RNA polymerase sigma factor (sigma-70 family)
LSTVVTDIHRELIESSKLGNPRAQEHLYRHYAKAMFNICRRMTNNHAEAEDLLQESFADAFYRLNSFRFESTFGVWLKRIVVNHNINHLKKKRADLVPIDDLSMFEDRFDHDDDVDAKEWNVSQIMKAFEQLPDGYRVIFSLYLLEGYDHTEISEILGISESTSKSQFLRAKQKIRDIINKI